MKAVTKGILAVIIAAALCILLAVVIINGPGADEKKTDRQSDRPQATIDDGSAWPMFRGGQSLLGRASGALPDSLKVVWKFKTNGQVKSSPVIAGGRVFVGSSDKNIYALDIHDGRKVWSYEAADAVGKVGVLLGPSGLQNPSAHTLRIGEALANIFEIRSALYQSRPDLAPDQESMPVDLDGFNREMGDLLIQNDRFLAKNSPSSALENISEFLANNPPEDLAEIAKSEAERIKRLFNV